MLLALARLIRVQGGDSSAIQYLNQQLEKTPYLSGVLELLRYQLPHAEGELQTNLHRLQEMIDQLLSRRPFYRCNHCGYEAKSLYWLCPSCQKWDRMQPIMEASKLWN
jgi:lipopolysaccharide biosynthesis regulator YciM